MSILVIFIPIFGFLVNIITQIFFYKFIMKKGLLKSEYAGFVFGFIFLLICEALVYINPFIEWVFSLCVNLITYSCLSYCNFCFINMGQTARRIRILRELYDEPQGLTKEQLLRKYNAYEIINIRLSRLLNNHQVILRNGRYYIGNQVMLLISKGIVLMKLIILGKKSEFD